VAPGRASTDRVRAGRGACFFFAERNKLVGTTINDLIGRRGGVRDVQDLDETLEDARRLFADVSAFLELELDRLFDIEVEGESLDEGRYKVVTDLIRQNQKALMMVLEIKAKLGRDTASDRARLVDLDDAREEITRRLARLAA